MVSLSSVEEQAHCCDKHLSLWYVTGDTPRNRSVGVPVFTGPDRLWGVSRQERGSPQARAIQSNGQSGTKPDRTRPRVYLLVDTEDARRLGACVHHG